MDLFIELLSDLIEAVLLLCVFEIFMDEKKYIFRNKMKSFLFCSIFTIFLYFSSTYITVLYHTLINISFSILLLIFIIRLNAFSSAMIYFIFCIILLVSEIGIAIVEMLIFNIDINQIIASQKYRMILTVFSKSLQIAIIAILFKFKFSIKKFKIFNDNYSIYSNFIFSIGVLGIITIWLSVGFQDFNNKSIYNVLLLILYGAFLILLARDLSERNRLIKIKNKYQVQEYQINNMEQIIAIIKKEKHDYADHIKEIQALCDLNEPNSLDFMKEYISEITNSIHDSFKFLNTGNDYIDGLLSIKSNYAQKNNIVFNVVINDTLDILKIKSEEIISIISNLIDNSFEAFDDTADNKGKSVYFETCLRDDKFIIEIGDNGKEIPKDIIENIFEKGFSTKGDKNSDHGYGLFITKELVEKNHGVIRVESDEFETVFTIIFNL